LKSTTSWRCTDSVGCDDEDEHEKINGYTALCGVVAV
jgi:hypothetical protein